MTSAHEAEWWIPGKLAQVRLGGIYRDTRTSSGFSNLY
jgi:hypothetical protein